MDPHASGVDHGVSVVDLTAATLHVSARDGHRVGLSVHRFDESRR